MAYYDANWPSKYVLAPKKWSNVAHANLYLWQPRNTTLDNLITEQKDAWGNFGGEGGGEGGSMNNKYQLCANKNE